MTDAPNNPKPLQPRIPIWIGGRGEKRTLRAAAKYADGWNGAYIGPDDWKHKCEVLDRWCETEGRDPKTIMRTVNLGFYLGADAKGAARGEEVVPPPLGRQRRARRPHRLPARHGEGRPRDGRRVPRARLHAALHRVPRRARTTGTRWRPSRPRSCARADLAPRNARAGTHRIKQPGLVGELGARRLPT